MPLNTTPMYSLRDVAIIPAELSNILSRSECSTYYYDNKQYHLPIFTAPMSAVVNIDNLEIWKTNNIIPIIPRNIDFNIRIEYAQKGYWIAVSLHEFIELSNKSFYQYFTDINQPIHLLVDIANGHMSNIYDHAENIKLIADDNGIDLKIMVGNIANPDIIRYISERNKQWKNNSRYVKNTNIIDYIRVGIGSGRCCSSSSGTSIHYGMASLLDEINNIKSVYGNCPKIIADGGIKTYNDAITALALGADYVMIGTTFASLFESAAQFVSSNMIKNNIYQSRYDITTSEDNKRAYIKNAKKSLKKYVYGMSTYVAQKEIKTDPTKYRLTEGIGRYVVCNMTVNEWTEGFIGYLRSCMSYCNKRLLSGFIGKVQCRVMSPMLNSVINDSMDNYINNDIHIIDETQK